MSRFASATDRKSTRLNSSHGYISYSVFFFNDPATTEIYTLSLHDALPILRVAEHAAGLRDARGRRAFTTCRGSRLLPLLDAHPSPLPHPRRHLAGTQPGLHRGGLLMAAWRARRRPGGRGQALVEFAFVLPFFLTVVFGIIVLGLAVFYQQQLANAAREAARYAAVHSATSQCPTVSWLDPTLANQPDSYYRCDPPQDGWPRLSAAGRKAVFRLAPSSVPT